MESTVFKNGNSLAIRLVGDCKLPKGTRVREYREGNRIIIEPVSEWPDSFVKSLGSWEGDFPRMETKKSKLRDPFEIEE